MGFAQGLAVVRRWIKKIQVRNKTELRLRCSFITDKPLSYSVSPDWNLKPGFFGSFIKDKQLSYSVCQRWLRGLLRHNEHIHLSGLHTYLWSNIITQNVNQFRSWYQNQVIFDPRTQNEPNPILKLKPGQVYPTHWNQVNTDHPDKNHTGINFDAHTKTKPFAARIQLPSLFRPPPPLPHKTKPFDHDTQNKFVSAPTRLISIDRTKNISLPSPTLKPSQTRSLTPKSNEFRRHYWNQVHLIPTLKSSQLRCPHIKNKLISIYALKPSIVRPSR